MQAKRVRFWTMANGSPVRVTVRSGEETAYAGGIRHEEGFTAWATRWYLDFDQELADAGCDGWFLVEMADAWGRDCDGRWEESSVSHCNLDRLAVRGEGAERYPDWHRVEAGQRDYTAEAAGY